MILIIGGMGSGKGQYVLDMGYSPDDISNDINDDKPVLADLQDLVFAAPDNAMELLPALEKKQVILCDEVGSGIIPVERNTREGREATGRLCILLAKQAKKVIRMVCGIPQEIK